MAINGSPIPLSIPSCLFTMTFIPSAGAHWMNGICICLSVGAGPLSLATASSTTSATSGSVLLTSTVQRYFSLNLCPALTLTASSPLIRIVLLLPVFISRYSFSLRDGCFSAFATEGILPPPLGNTNLISAGLRTKKYRRAFASTIFLFSAYKFFMLTAMSVCVTPVEIKNFRIASG